jgi:peptide/nickel transport system substrate-binding protein
MSKNEGAQRPKAGGFLAHGELQTLHAWVADVGAGRLARRDFIQRLAACGIAAPMAGLLLSQSGGAHAQTLAKPIPYKPTQRGGGGTLKMLFWQAASSLNPHFATGLKDSEACSLFYESLVVWDKDGQMVPVLAAEIPTRENGGLAADGKSVLWRLKKGVTWHDGTPFTADDVVFNYQYATDKAAAAYTAGSYLDVVIEKVDEHSIRARFPKAQPFWPGVYSTVLMVPRHVFAPYSGAKSREAPANLKPVGTGPYKIVDFKPGDLLKASINMGYHLVNRPHFDVIDIKGGGDATSAARAVLQTGEFDYGWNIQVEDEILKRIETGGRGRMEFDYGADIEHIQLTLSDPWSETEGERAHPKSKHPVLGDVRVRQALSLLVDRKSIQEVVYGRLGNATANYLNGPAQFRSSALAIRYDPERAGAELDAAGWPRVNGAGGGMRMKDGKPMKLLFSSSTSSARQKVQNIVKAALQKQGIEVEIKAVVASVFFSSDMGNPDVYGKSWADMQMYAWVQGMPDPMRTMQSFASWELSQKSNGWLGLNRSRYQNPEYDRLYRASEVELDLAKRAALFMRMNDMVCSEAVVIPIVHRAKATAVGNSLRPALSAWANDMALIAHWYREA